MSKKIKHIIILILISSNLFSSSVVKSLFLPGWGEKNEFRVLSETYDSEREVVVVSVCEVTILNVCELTDVIS